MNLYLISVPFSFELLLNWGGGIKKLTEDSLYTARQSQNWNLSLIFGETNKTCRFRHRYNFACLLVAYSNFYGFQPIFFLWNLQFRGQTCAENRFSVSLTHNHIDNNRIKTSAIMTTMYFHRNAEDATKTRFSSTKVMLSST